MTPPLQLDELQTVGATLREAVRVLATPEALERTPEGLSAWGIERSRQRPKNENLWTGGMQEHTSLEVALAVSGVGVLDVGRTRFRFPAPALAFIGSGLLHSEGFFSKTQSYASLWFGITSQDRVMVHVSEYTPAAGWACPWSREFPKRTSARLMPWFRPEAAMQPLELEPLRAELLAALSELYRDIVRRRNVVPEAGNQGPATRGHRRVLEWVRGYLDRHYRRTVTVAEVAKLTRYSPNYLDALFSAWSGRGMHAYLIERRMEEAYRLCQASDMSVQAVAAAVGYDDAFYFSRAFRRYHGQSPSQAQARPRASRRLRAPPQV